MTEGFTVGTPPKYKPVWKGEGFLVNSEEGIGKKFRRLCLRNPPASAVPRHPHNGQGGFGLCTPKAPLRKGAGTAGEPPVAFAVTEGFTVGDFSKAPTHVDTCQPGESPRLGVAEAPPFNKGGFGLRPKTPPDRREV